MVFYIQALFSDYSTKYELCAGHKNYVYSQKVNVLRQRNGFRILKEEPLKETVLGGHDSCLGDSGGPLWRVLGSTKPTAFIIGVVSRGLNCANSKAPGIYTRIKQYIPWIYKVCFYVEGKGKGIYVSSYHTISFYFNLLLLQLIFPLRSRMQKGENVQEMRKFAIEMHIK